MTQKEIAGKTGISRSAISHFLSGRHQFLSKNRQKQIAAALERYGYQPNLAAKTLRSKKSGIIGILTPGYNTQIAMLKMDAVENAILDAGYHTLLGCTHNQEEKEKKYVREFIARNIDGIIYIPTFEFDDTHLVKKLKAKNIPLVVLDPLRDYGKVDSISIDREYGTSRAVDYLINLGHKKIAIFYCSFPDDLKKFNPKLKGYKESLRRNNIKLNPSFVFDIYPLYSEGLAFYEAAYKLARQFFSNKKGLPTGILCNNDEIAMAVIRAAKEEGISVPDNLSVIGFDDIEYARYFLPALTTVRQPREEMAEYTTKFLFQRIKSPGIPVQNIVLKPELQVRGSTASAEKRQEKIRR